MFGRAFTTLMLLSTLLVSPAFAENGTNSIKPAQAANEQTTAETETNRATTAQANNEHGVANSSGISILGKVLFPGEGNRRRWEHAGQLQDEAVFLTMSKHYEKAVKKALAAIAIYPYDYCFYNTLGIAYSRRDNPGDIELACQAFEQSIKLCTDDPMVWDNIAKIYEVQHELSRAKQAWLMCLALRPRKQLVQEINDNIRRCDQQLSMQ